MLFEEQLAKFQQERPVRIVSTEDYAEAEQTNMMQIEEN